MIEIINTCFATTEGYRSIASYAHLLPAGIMLVMAFFLLSRSRKILNISFSIFILFFVAWLVGDWFVWISNDYHLVNAWWSTLDYLDIASFVTAVYFYTIFTYGKDVPNKYKFLLALLTVFPLVLTLMGQSILGFHKPVCESDENPLIVNYRFILEIACILAIVIIGFFSWKKARINAHKKSFIIVTLSLLLFLTTFAVTGFIASQTYVYEVQLYGMFILPVFLMFMIMAVSRYDVFGLKFFNQGLLAWILVPLVASQFFFLNNISDFVLNFITLAFSFVIVYLLSKSIRKENENRAKIEQLNKELLATNDHLRELDKQKTEFVSVASHQLRGPLTAIKGYASLILEGDLGPISDALKTGIETIFRSTQALVVIVGDYLDASRIEQGRMRYEFSDFDVKPLVDTVITEFQPNVRLTGLQLEYSIEEGKDYLMHGDQGKIKQVISNIIDNSIKYTEKGVITVSLKRTENDKIVIAVKDSGIGIAPEVLPRLFEKFSRAPGASKTNTTGTGLGLYVAKKMIEAHRGRIWAESEGQGKGSTFLIEMDALHKTPTEINEKLEHIEETEGKKIEEELSGHDLEEGK